MKKRIFAIFLCLFLVSGLSFGQHINTNWIKTKYTKILKFDKQLLVKELSSAPSLTAGYGTLYALSSDGELYYKDDDGNAIAITGSTAAVDTSGTPVDNDFAKFTDANTIEGRSYTETASDLEAAIEAAIDTLANLTSIQGQTVTFSAGLTVESASTTNQDTTTDATPTFAGVTVDGGAGGSVEVYDSDQSNSITQTVGVNLASNVAWKLNSYSPVKTVIIKVYADDGTLTLADGEGYFTVPIELDGMDLVSVGAHVYTASGGGTAVNISIYNVGNTVDMLTTQLTIDNTEKDSATAATPAVISATAANKLVNTGDEVRVDVNQIGDASTKGLEIRLGFQLVA